MGKKNKISKPYVSIVTPTYNRPNFIKILFKNIIKQKYPIEKLEWIIVDGQNNDNLKNELPKLIDEFRNQSKLKIIYELLPMSKNIKIGGLRNKTNELASGDIIVCMDDDDYYSPNRVINAVKALKYGKLDLAGSNIAYIYDFDLNELIRFGPTGNNNNTTNNFMAYTKKYANENKYIDDCPSGEELHFTKNYTNKMAKLNHEDILQFSHYQNTYNKRQMFEIAFSNNITQNLNYYNIPNKSKLLNMIPEDIFNEYSNICLTEKRHQSYSKYDIVYYCGIFNYVDWKPTDKSLGGSEQAIVKLTEYWASKGFKVAVYLKIDKKMTHNNVDYIPSNTFKASLKYKKIILWRSLGSESFLQWDVNADDIYLDLHDTSPPLILKTHHHKLSKIFTKSFYHNYATLRLLGKEEENNDEIKKKLIPIMNGIRVDEFEQNKNIIRNKYRLSYTSAYNRGLLELLKYFFPILKNLVPKAEFHIYYGYSTKEKDKELMDEIRKLINNTEGVYEHGRVGIEKIIEEKYKSNFHLYLTKTGAETDCISIRESLVTGCIPIISNYGVFEERDGIKFKVELKDTTSYIKIAKRISEIMVNDKYCHEIRKKLKFSKTIKSWNDIGFKWLKQMNLEYDIKLDSMKNIKKSYVINLERRPDKLIEFFDRYPYKKENVEIFKAVDGSKITLTDEIKKILINYIKKNPHKDGKYGPIKGELGCTLSHIKIWKSIINNEDLDLNDMVAIFEDDAFFYHDFDKIWNKNNIPNDVDLLYIGGRFNENYIPKNILNWCKIKNNLYVTNFEDRTTHSYIISKKGAYKLLKLVEEDGGIYHAIDHWLRDKIQFLKSYTILPLLCWSPLNYKSDIKRNGKNYFNLDFNNKTL